MSKKMEIYNYENGIKSLEFLLKNIHLQTNFYNQNEEEAKFQTN